MISFFLMVPFVVVYSTLSDAPALSMFFSSSPPCAASVGMRCLTPLPTDIFSLLTFYRPCSPPLFHPPLSKSRHLIFAIFISHVLFCAPGRKHLLYSLARAYLFVSLSPFSPHNFSCPPSSVTLTFPLMTANPFLSLVPYHAKATIFCPRPTVKIRAPQKVFFFAFVFPPYCFSQSAISIALPRSRIFSFSFSTPPPSI